MQRLYSKPVTSLAMNISLLGMNGSGKSAILVKYLTRRFIVEYAPYLSDSYTKTDNVDGLDVLLNIQDTSDSDDMDLDEILKWSQAVIVLFSITSRRSFYRAKELIESIKQNSESHSVGRQIKHASHNSPNNISPAITSSGSCLPSPVSPPTPGHSGTFRRAAMCGMQTVCSPAVVLVANKSDLDRFRLVEKSEAEDFAKVKGVSYFETTAAATYEKVQSIFHSVVRLSNKTRLGKGRAQEGMGTITVKNLSSSTGTLGNNAAASVLSSLAVSPGLLLQKKNPTSVTVTQVQDSGNTTPNVETELAVNSLSRLANLKFRAGSPPNFAKNLRSPSPSIPSNRASNLSPTIANIANTQSLMGAKLVNEGMTTRSVTPSSQNRTNPPTNPQSTKQGATEETNTKKQIPTPAATPHPTASPTAGPPKKSSIGFRLFGKKTK